MLALALLPTVSHALAFAQGGKSAWAEICTPQGMKVVAVESAPGDESAPVAAHLDHCAFCAQAATTLGMPPAPAAVAALALAAIEPPALFLQAPRTASPGPPRSRAPRLPSPDRLMNAKSAPR